jgi:hypothetical protein
VVVLLLSNQLCVRISVGRPDILRSHLTILREFSGHQLKNYQDRILPYPFIYVYIYVFIRVFVRPLHQSVPQHNQSPKSKNSLHI